MAPANPAAATAMVLFWTPAPVPSLLAEVGAALLPAPGARETEVLLEGRPVPVVLAPLEAADSVVEVAGSDCLQTRV